MVKESDGFRGIYSILATCFSEDGTIDYGSQESLIEFCLECGVHGLVTLANASEGHLLSDRERQELQIFVIKQVNERVPVIVTVNHPSAVVISESALFAERAGASAVMSLPPFFGRWRGGHRNRHPFSHPPCRIGTGRRRYLFQLHRRGMRLVASAFFRHGRHHGQDLRHQ